MRIGLKLLSENNKYEVFRFSIFNIAKLRVYNLKQVDNGDTSPKKDDPIPKTYVWDLKGECYTSNQPIYDIENLIAEEEQKFNYTMLVNMAKIIDEMVKKDNRKKTRQQNNTK
jgi:hypothetical protein